MVYPLILIGGAYLILKKGKDDGKGSFKCVYPQIKIQNDRGEWVCGLDPDFKPPQPTDEVLEDTWDMVYNEGKDYVWKLGVGMGLAYDDDSSSLHYEYFYMIGNEEGNAFARESQTDYGHYQTQYGYAKVYSDEAAAIARVVELNEPSEDDPLDPTQPQPDDEEDEEDDGFGGLPTQPSFGLGYNPSFGAGGF